MKNEVWEIPVCGLCPDFYLCFCKKYGIPVSSLGKPLFQCKGVPPDLEIAVEPTKESHKLNFYPVES